MMHSARLLAATALLALGSAIPAYALDEITFGTNWVTEPEHGGHKPGDLDEAQVEPQPDPAETLDEGDDAGDGGEGGGHGTGTQARRDPDGPRTPPDRW